MALAFTLIAVDASTSFAQKGGKWWRGRQQASRASEYQVRWLHHQSSANGQRGPTDGRDELLFHGDGSCDERPRFGSTAHKPPSATCDWVTMQTSSCFGLHGSRRTSRSLGLDRARPRFLGATGRTMGLRHSASSIALHALRSICCWKKRTCPSAITAWRPLCDGLSTQVPCLRYRLSG